MAKIQWIGQSATARSSDAANLRLLNGYTEVIESQQGKAITAIWGTPGLRRFTTLGTSGPVRGLYTTSQGRLFTVGGSSFAEISSTGALTARGTIDTTGGPVAMKDNGIDLVLVDGQRGYALTLATNAFAALADPIFLHVHRVEYVDSRFVFPVGGAATAQFMWSEPLSTTIDGLNFATAEGSPDLLVSLLVAHREVWLFGQTTTEVWATTGLNSPAFARIQGAFIETGCLAAHSPAVVGDTVYWLAADAQGRGVVVQAAGFVPRRVSTHPVEDAIQGYVTSHDAIGWGQQEHGHLFYWLTFPLANATWVYDVTTGLWHERGYRTPSTNAIGRHRANSYSFAFGRHLCGDWSDGRIYELDTNYYTDDGDPLIFSATLPPLFSGDSGRRFEQTYLQISAETGIGLDGSPPGNVGVDPQIALQISDDSGHTFSSEMWRPMGKIGEKFVTVEYWRLGTSFDRRLKITIDSPVKRAILGAYTEIRPLG